MNITVTDATQAIIMTGIVNRWPPGIYIPCDDTQWNPTCIICRPDSPPTMIYKDGGIIHDTFGLHVNINYRPVRTATLTITH